MSGRLKQRGDIDTVSFALVASSQGNASLRMVSRMPTGRARPLARATPAADAVVVAWRMLGVGDAIARINLWRVLGTVTGPVALDLVHPACLKWRLEWPPVCTVVRCTLIMGSRASPGRRDTERGRDQRGSCIATATYVTRCALASVVRRSGL